MKELNRLGLGTMGMSIVRNPENSVETVYAALDAGKLDGKGMCSFMFTDGIMSMA